MAIGKDREIATHEIVETLHIVIDDPAHVARTESAKFHHNRAYLITTCKLGCWLCQWQKEKFGTEPGTGTLEAHHVFEWSEWDALDPDIVTKILGKLQFNQFAGHPVGDPDDLPNLVILHESCHRGAPGKDATSGAHYTPFPIWLAQAAARQGMTITRDIEHLLDHLKGQSHDVPADY
jgi:5-methylcytosine-specific restriction endonuclease McrA